MPTWTQSACEGSNGCCGKAGIADAGPLGMAGLEKGKYIH